MGRTTPPPHAGGKRSERASMRAWAWALVGLGAAAILVGVASPAGGLPAIRRLGRDVERLEARRRELSVENAELRARVRAQKHGAEALEWQARSHLHLVRDSERVYRSSSQSADASSEAADPARMR